MYILLAFANNKNFEEATKLTSFMGFVIVSDIKVFSIWSQRARIGALMRDLYALYPKTLAEQQLYNVKGELQRYKRFAYAFILLHEVLVWSYNLFPLLNYLINDLWLGIREVIMELPYYCWMPFDWRGNWRFYPMLIHQMGAGQASFSGQLANDLLLSAVAVQLIMHYRRLARQLETHAAGLGSDTEKKHKKSALACSARDLQFLRDIIVKHQMVLKLSQEFNEIFGISLFISFTFTVLIICFVLFHITIGASIDSLLMLVFFFFCSWVQIFLICYYAQGVLEASENISQAVYNHNWYDADLRYKKIILLIMQRAQKPAKLQATSLVTVTMSTMTGMLQISYKGFAVIRTMYAREPRKV
ncbi:putative odorant receptor 85d [Anastrepha obliqua]|uniref:putative odorant receptor 85d n=1 Tax=Anastrepha obliqua TaxID=95512 RepID=UPI00240A687D|nr:putative odorant receptor 85d [Anastrepha obliqua]